jgi:hypothetical protein
LFADADREIHHIIEPFTVKRWRRFDVAQLNPVIDDRRHMAELSGSSLDWLTVLALQAPRAAIAQHHMDKHPNGYDGGHARLYELIDFNDSFVSTVLSLPESLLPDFQTEAKQLMDNLCTRLRTPRFSDEQYEAITHGLSREIAVYRGLQREGLSVSMTSRVQDAKGVDMIVSDPETGATINVDVKTRSAFYYRLKDLRSEGRITKEAAEQAEVDGFCEVRNGHSADGVDVILLRIDPDDVGEIKNFSFADTAQLGVMVRHILAAYGATIEAGKEN